MNISFWPTTFIWGIGGLFSIYFESPEYYHDYWLGWFGTMAVIGFIGWCSEIIKKPEKES